MRGSKRWLLQASETIETALLMPLILLIIFTVISFDLFMISRSTCESAAAEQAVSGKTYSDLFLPGSSAAERTGNESASSRNVAFHSGTDAVYGRFHWAIEAKASYTKVHPVNGIRLSRAAAGLIRHFAGRSD